MIDRRDHKRLANQQWLGNLTILTGQSLSQSSKHCFIYASGEIPALFQIATVPFSVHQIPETFFGKRPGIPGKTGYGENEVKDHVPRNVSKSLPGAAELAFERESMPRADPVSDGFATQHPKDQVQLAAVRVRE